MSRAPFWQMTRAQAEWVTALRDKLAADKHNTALRRELNLTLGPLTIDPEQRAAHARMLEDLRQANIRHWWRFHGKWLDRLHGRQRGAA